MGEGNCNTPTCISTSFDLFVITSHLQYEDISADSFNHTLIKHQTVI